MSKRKSARTHGTPLEPSPLPTPAERDAIADARMRVGNRSPRLHIDPALLNDDGKTATPHDDLEGWQARFQDAFGTRGTAFAAFEFGQLLRAARTRDGKIESLRLNSFMAVLDGARPANEIEAMLASQIAVAHSLAMDFLVRAKNAEDLVRFDSAGRMAAKLLVAFAGHVELLNKLRRGGKQTVRVEHVHVHPGAQAIVGNVDTGGREVGKSERQPHATENNQAGSPGCFAIEPSSALLRQDAIGESLPSSGGERQVPVPNARRREG